MHPRALSQKTSREGEMFRFLGQRRWEQRTRAENDQVLPAGDGGAWELLRSGMLGLQQQSRWQRKWYRIPAEEPHPPCSPALSSGNSYGWPAFSCCRIRPSSAGSTHAPQRSSVTRATHKSLLAQAATTEPTMPLRFEGTCAFTLRIIADLPERQLSAANSPRDLYRYPSRRPRSPAASTRTTESVG